MLQSFIKKCCTKSPHFQAIFEKFSSSGAPRWGYVNPSVGVVRFDLLKGKFVKKV